MDLYIFLCFEYVEVFINEKYYKFFVVVITDIISTNLLINIHIQTSI